MSEREEGSNTANLLPGGFEAVQGVVSGMAIAFRRANGPETERLSVPQGFALQKVAAEGIFDLLDQVDIKDITTLTAELKKKMAADSYTDLTAVEISAQNELHKLNHELEGRQRALARAVGATARATVAVVTGSNQQVAQASLARERKIIETADEPLQVNGVVQAGAVIDDAAQSALSLMLDKLENPPLAQIKTS